MKSKIIEFENFNIKTADKVFSPREDVEIFPKVIKDIIKNKNHIIELGTGTGAISISIAKSFNNVEILATDINPSALEIATLNAKLNDVSHLIKFKKSNWFKDIKNEKFDFILSNPPYLSKYNGFHYKDLSDPNSSLYSQENGLYDIYKIIKSGIQYLNDNSYMVIEHSHNQTLYLKDFTKAHGLQFIKSEKDNFGFNRVSVFSNRV
jgi:release factor glutamine methyltransferase